METVRGIVDHDTIRLVTPLALPQGAEIEFEPRIVVPSTPAQVAAPPSSSDGMDAIYEILSRRFNSGHHDTAERHNEHQP
jgi:hypothetical protein